MQPQHHAWIQGNPSYRGLAPARALLIAAAIGLASLAPAWGHSFLFTLYAGQPGEWGWEDGNWATCWFNHPTGLAGNGQEPFFVADSLNNLIRIMQPSGNLGTFSGRLLFGEGSHAEPEPDDGCGPATHFHHPLGLCLLTNGCLLVADTWHHTIRQITPDGCATTLVGLPNTYGFADGSGTTARLNAPVALARDQAGNVFVAEQEGQVIRKLDATGQLTLFAGVPEVPGHQDGPGLQALFNRPAGLAFDLTGNLLVADEDNQVIRRITPDGIVSTVAGSPGLAGHADGRGSDARLDAPCALSVDGAGNCFFTERVGNLVRRLSPAGDVLTLAGFPREEGWDDGVGTEARFRWPAGILALADGSVMVADSGNHCLRWGRPAPLPTLEWRRGPNGMEVWATGLAGCEVVVEATDSIVGEIVWTEVDRFVLGHEPRLVTGAQPSGFRQKYYRVQP